MFGECTKENAFELLDTFYDLGGNFIDTANVYQGGQSEEWIGDWLQKTGRRDEMGSIPSGAGTVVLRFLILWQSLRPSTLSATWQINQCSRATSVGPVRRACMYLWKPA